jgi:hypothetical protein
MKLNSNELEARLLKYAILQTFFGSLFLFTLLINVLCKLHIPYVYVIGFISFGLLLCCCSKSSQLLKDNSYFKK